MKKECKLRQLLLWMISVLLILSFPSYSQSTITITTPRLELQNNRLLIGYDIQNSQSQDEFKVRLSITNAAGNLINAVSLSGDIGEGIKGGTNKRIVWDIAKDGLSLNEDIFVEVYADKIKPSVTEEKSLPAESETTSAAKSYSRANLLVSSLAMPGLGQLKIKKKKVFLLMGTAGYGCLLGSVLMNRQAINTYQDYQDSKDVDERNTLYNKSVNQDKTSENLARTAAGIWAVNIIWTIIVAENSKKLADLQRSININIYPGYNPEWNCTMVSLSYKF